MQDKESDGKLVAIVARAICRRSVKASRLIAPENHEDAINECWHLCAEEAREYLTAIKSAGLVILARSDVEDMIEGVESWGAYADQYFQNKHDLAGEIARYRAMITAGEE